MLLRAVLDGVYYDFPMHLAKTTYLGKWYIRLISSVADTHTNFEKWSSVRNNQGTIVGGQSLKIFCVEKMGASGNINIYELQRLCDCISSYISSCVFKRIVLRSCFEFCLRARGRFSFKVRSRALRDTRAVA